MSENILTKKMYSKNKDTGVETQVYPETNAASVVDLESYISGKNYLSSTEVNNRINTAVGSIQTSESTSSALANLDFSLSDGLTEGTYIVTNATNSPFKGETSGVLKVISTGSGSSVQTWSGRKYTGYREIATFNPLEAELDSITINGVKVNTNISDEYSFIGNSQTNAVKFTNEELDTYNQNSHKIMWLYPGGTYELSGVLFDCQIRIGYLPNWYKDGTTSFNSTSYDNSFIEYIEVSGEQQANDKYDPDCVARKVTTIKLNGFYLKETTHLEYDLGDDDSPEAAISQFQPLIFSEIAGKDSANTPTLVIELAGNSKNYLHRVTDTGMETWNNKWGVIYTEGNCTIKGTGSLGINDGGTNSTLLGGHAIKAKCNLLVQGTPHISARVYHDVLHGNESVIVEGGYFQAIYCNDVFGTDTTRGDDGVGIIRVYNGVFDARRCFGTFVQADDAIIYPGVKISFNTIGEGLWLQCKNGIYKSSTLKGECSGFGIINDQTKKFSYYKFKKMKPAGASAKINPDAGAIDFSNFDASTDITLKSGVPSKATINYNGSAIQWDLDGEKCKVDVDMGGIIVYAGVMEAVTPDAEYSYTESDRNTHVSSLTLAQPVPASFNHDFVATATTENITGAKTVAEAAEYPDCLTANANFGAIDFTYTGTATGGVWNIGVTEFGLNEYKNEVSTALTLLKGMIVPPKTVAISNIQSLDFDLATGTYALAATNSRVDAITNTGAEIAKGAAVSAADGQKTAAKIKEDGYLYTSGTKLVPTFHIGVGESIRISATMEPNNATNGVFKWSVVGVSEETVIARIKDESTAVSYCDIRGLQVGHEDIVLSAKALNKDNLKLSVLIHIVVDAPESQAD